MRLGWRWVPRYRYRVTAGDLESDSTDSFDTITAQSSSNGDAKLLLDTKVNVTASAFGYEKTWEALRNTYDLNAIFNDAHTSVMLTNGDDYVRAVGHEDNYDFQETLASYDATSCRDALPNTPTAMVDGYDASNVMVQDAMTEETMLACYDGDYATSIPPINPGESDGDLFLAGSPKLRASNTNLE